MIVRLSAPGGAASEGLPRRCRLGLAVGMLEARKPKTLQQVSAVWTRPGLTGWLGPVLRDTRSGPPSEVWMFPRCPPWSQEAEERLGYPSHLLPGESQGPLPNSRSRLSRGSAGVSQGHYGEGFTPDQDPSLLVLFLCCLHTKSHKDKAGFLQHHWPRGQRASLWCVCYRQGDRAAGVTLPQAREGTTQGCVSCGVSGVLAIGAATPFLNMSDNP